MNEIYTHRSGKNVLIWIVLGAVVGWVASSIVGTRSNLIIDIIVGIAGSFIGGWILGKTNHGVVHPGEFSWRGFLTALLGAIVLLLVVKVLS